MSTSIITDDNGSEGEKSECGNGIPPAPHPQLRALPIPVWLIDLVRLKVISPGEAFAVAYIDGLVTYGGIACWASNSHLANAFGMTSNGVSLMVKRLVEIGVLIRAGHAVIGNLKYRLLETPWSRTADAEMTADAMAAEMARMTHKAVKVYLAPGLGKLRNSASKKVRGYTPTFLDGTPKESLTGCNTKVKSTVNNNQTPARLRRDGRAGDSTGDDSASSPNGASVATNGKHAAAGVGSPLFASGQLDPTPRASKLYAAVRNRLMGGSYKLRDWEKWFTRLIGELAAEDRTPLGAAAEVDRLLDGYIYHLRQGTKYLPQIRCGETFYRKRQKLYDFLELNPASEGARELVRVDLSDGTFVMRPAGKGGAR